MCNGRVLLMNVLTFDVETTHTEKRGGGYTPLPYFGNRLVSIGYKWLVSSVDYDCYYHSTEPPTQAAAEKFQLSLDHADVLIGQNIKFDLRGYASVASHTRETSMIRWLRNIYYPRRGVGLSDLLLLQGSMTLPRRRQTLLSRIFKEGKTFYDIPWDIIKEYGCSRRKGYGRDRTKTTRRLWRII